jgi:hypothetical protein
MDPNAALKRLVQLSEQLIDEHEFNHGDLTIRATELAETFLALDEWLRKGGFKPHPWIPKQ